MARELRRLLIEPERLATVAADAQLPLRQEEDHYLARVLRLRAGDPVALVDGCGGLWQACRGPGAWLTGLRRLAAPLPQPRPPLTLALALPRQDVELVWRMATELGIDRLQPLRAERSQLAGRREPTQRWQAVVREATEQCERLWLPDLAPLQEASAWLQAPPDGVALLATTRRQLPSLEQLLDQQLAERSDLKAIALCIGPEGGWSAMEEEQAAAAGWHAVSLGDAILRSSTAAVAGVSRLVAWRHRHVLDRPGDLPAEPSSETCADANQPG